MYNTFPNSKERIIFDFSQWMEKSYKNEKILPIAGAAASAAFRCCHRRTHEKPSVQFITAYFSRLRAQKQSS